MVFSAISRASLFEADDDIDDPVAARQEKILNASSYHADVHS